MGAHPGGRVDLRIASEQGGVPAVFDASLFVTTDESIPPTWRLRVADSGVVKLGPAEWLVAGFWERYFDDEPEALAAYDRELGARQTGVSHPDVSAPVDRGDRWDVPITGATVDQCCFDDGVVLRLSSDAGPWELRVERTIVVTGDDDVERVAMPVEATRGELVTAALHATVVQAVAHKDGALEIGLDSGVRVAVSPDETNEAWELIGPAGVRLVSLPGGDLAMWGPDAPYASS